MKTLQIIFLTTFVTLASFVASFAQSGNDWVRVRNGNIPNDAVEGGTERNGQKTFVCRARHRGNVYGGRAELDRCYFNPGNREISASRFDVLVGKYKWSRTRSYDRAIIAGGNDSYNFFVCRVKTSGGIYPGRTEDGRCYYTRQNRGYSSSRFEVLNGRNYTNTLIRAASRGKYRDVRDALRDGQAINQRDDKGKTALMIAAEKGYSSVVRELLYERPTLDLVDESGNTAMMFAASNGRTDIFQTLLRANADPNVRNRDGDTAFTLAASFGQERMVEDFLRNQISGDILQSDVEKGFRNAAYGGHTRVLRILLNYGANIESPDGYGKTALMNAASGGRAETVRFLLENDANVNAQDDQRSWSPFLYAVDSNAESVLRVFWEEKEFVKAVDKEAERGLHIAAENDRKKSLRYLLSKGVDVNSKSIDREYTALMYAALNGRKDICEILIQSNADLNVQNGLGESALMLAAANSKNNVTKFLIKAGAELDLRDTNGLTALGLAIKNKHKDTRKTLKKAGAKQ